MIVRGLVRGWLILGLGSQPLIAQSISNQTASIPLSLSSRYGLTAGMGVSYVDAADIVNIVNENVVVSQRVPSYRSGVELFGSAIIPVTGRVAVKVGYSYLLFSFNGATFYGPGEFTVQAHLPSVIVQYVLMDAQFYNLKVGAGGGYHLGSVSENYGTVNDRFSGSGAGLILELEGNTALNEHLYVFLGGDLRKDYIGVLSNAVGRDAGAVGEAPTLHFFSAGAKLGCSYFF